LRLTGTIRVATPVRKPVITECDTKCVRRPSRKQTGADLKETDKDDEQKEGRRPLVLADLIEAAPRCECGALVVVTTISEDAVRSRRPAVRSRSRTNHEWGSPPATTAAAMPSGTLPIAPMIPATVSFLSVAPRRGTRVESS